jgi:hypothetical protein
LKYQANPGTSVTTQPSKKREIVKKEILNKKYRNAILWLVIFEEIQPLIDNFQFWHVSVSVEAKPFDNILSRFFIVDQ